MRNVLPATWNQTAPAHSHVAASSLLHRNPKHTMALPLRARPAGPGEVTQHAWLSRFNRQIKTCIIVKGGTGRELEKLDSQAEITSCSQVSEIPRPHHALCMQERQFAGEWKQRWLRHTSNNQPFISMMGNLHVTALTLQYMLCRLRMTQ